MEHDSGRWGPLLAENQNDPDRPLHLARLADVVSYCARIGPFPVRVAAERVHKRLAELPDLRLYLLNPGIYAELVAHEYKWRNGHPGVDAHMEEIYRPGHFRPVPRRFGGDSVRVIATRLVPAVEAVPDLCGISGALTMLGEQWAEKATSTASFDAGKLASLAILTSDAAELFGYGVEVAQQPVQAPAPAAPVLHLVNTEPAPPAAPAMADDLPTKRRKAVARWRELGDIKGVRKKVGSEFNISERQFTRWIDTVQKEEAAARAEGAFNAGLSQLQTS